MVCGGQAFTVTPLFDPSMSALPITVKQNSQELVKTRQIIGGESRFKVSEELGE